MEKIQSIGIVLYNPDSLNNLDLDNLILSDNFYLFIYFNSEINSQLNIKLELLKNKSSKIFFLGNKVNVGLSKAFNSICYHASLYGMNNILLIDQDTIIFYESLISFKLPDTILENTVCVNLVSGSSKNNVLKKDKDFLINNGNIIFLKNHQLIGGFNENYFVELVDYEFQYRIIRNKYHYYKIYGSGIFDHSSNQGYEKVFFFNYLVRLRIYSNSRCLEYHENSKKLLIDLFKNKQFIAFFQFFAHSFSQHIKSIIQLILWKILK